MTDALHQRQQNIYETHFTKNELKNFLCFFPAYYSLVSDVKLIKIWDRLD